VNDYTSGQAVILLADDSEEDILLIRQAFQKANISNPFQVVQSGEEAISYLSGERKYSNRAEYPLPDLLLLDLKMPGTDGFQVLRWIRQRAGLEALRIVVLTSSEQIRDVNQAYRLGANSFMVKPMDFQDFVELSRVLHDYWLCKSKAPETSRNPPPTRPSRDATRDSGHG
jgi:CheY-like chemotaxis protein